MADNKLGMNKHRIMGGKDEVNEKLSKTADNFGKCAMKAKLTMGASGKLIGDRMPGKEKAKGSMRERGMMSSERY